MAETTDRTGNDPCPECPAIFWTNHRMSADFERQVRADAARLWQRREQQLLTRIEQLELEVRRLRAKAS